MPRGITVRRVETISAEVDAVDNRIRQRAWELSRANGGSLDPSLDWLRAERDICWRPAVELRRRGDDFVVVAAVAGVEPDEIQVAVTPEDLLVQANVDHTHDGDGDVHLCEFHRGPLFRTVHFPQPIEPDQMKVDLRNGLLRITAPVAGSAKAAPAPKPRANRAKKKD